MLLPYVSNYLILDLWKAELRVAQPVILRNDEMTVRLDMYSEKAREGAVSALKESFDDHLIPGEFSSSGVQGSFRKLEVD